MLDENDDLLEGFVEDARQHLQSVEPDLLALEQGGAQIDPEVINRIFRSVHSIKGAAGFFGLEKIGSLGHVMENLLSLIRDGKLTPASDMIDALLAGVDALRAMLDDVAGSEGFHLEQEMQRLQSFIGEAGPRETVTVTEKARETDQPVDGRHFHLAAGDLDRFVAQGLNLYAVKIFLNRDLKEKGRTPFDFINNMESLGQYVDAFLDISVISGLEDCLDRDLGFHFLFATILETDMVPEALDVPGDRIVEIDLDAFRAAHPEEREEPGAGESAPPTASPEPEAAAMPEPVAAPAPAPEPEPVPPPAEKPFPPQNGGTALDNARGIIQTDEKIRVGVGFLNDLVNLAGELVLGRNQLMQAALPLARHTTGLNPILQHISRVTSEMQEKIMQMRMQPISLIFDKFHRVVRSAAKKLNKEVRLITRGEEVDLDKTIIEGLSDPLTHLIRNAVDHGIESPAEREAAGKPRYGTIHLRAFHQGGQVHLEIRDDGRGISGEMIGQKAVEKGVISREELRSLSDAERIRLIFRPGFSTAETVTDLSGRGVGMDVVRTNIEHLGGTVDIQSRPGEGSRIVLVLPLTLAIVSGLHIRSSGQSFILPEADIEELVRIKPDEIDKRIDVVQDARVLRLRDSLLPLVDLGRVLAGNGSGARDTLLREQNEPVRVLVVRYGDTHFGLVVDEIVSTEEIVVKPLPRYLKKMKRFSGVSILGTGRVALILDVAGIAAKAAIRNIDAEAARARSRDRQGQVEKEMQTLLLFDNNTPERFGLPLELISRIEQFPAAEMERIRDHYFMQYHDRKLRLIFLEDYLPIGRPERPPGDTLGVIIPRQMRYPLGIVFHRVINTVAAVVELDTESIMAPGLFGSTVLEGKITLLPDIYRIFEMAAPEWYAPPENETAGKKPYRILLADDTPFFRMVESEYLASAGFDVTAVEDGRKALAALEEEAFDGVILDIVMPRMDGWGTIRAIRGDERFRRLPVIAVTSLEDDALARKGLEAGFDAWELKLNKTRLLEKLRTLIAAETGEEAGT